MDYDSWATKNLADGGTGRDRIVWEAATQAAELRCVSACESERLEEPASNPEDVAYERGIDDCVAAIRDVRGDSASHGWRPPKRFAPCIDASREDPDFNQLHYAYLLWVDYLRAATEEAKQQLLFEAGAVLTAYRVSNHFEGEELVSMVADAIRRRGRVFGRMHGSMPCYAEATADNKFALLRA